MNHSDRNLSYMFVFIQFACLGLFTLTGSLIARRPVLLVVQSLGVLVGVWAIWSIRLSNFNITRMSGEEQGWSRAVRIAISATRCTPRCSWWPSSRCWTSSRC